ncbi:MAG: FliH/SctL family protein [Schlesneria sp.]
MNARIIKAHSTHALPAVEVFNFVDLQEQGNQIVANARRDADQILNAARNDAMQLCEQVRAAARDDGRAHGLRESQEIIAKMAAEIADQQVTAQLATALPALQAAAESLQAERDRWLVRWEQIAVRLGVAIAEKLLQRQLAARPEFATEMISDALRLAAGQPQLTVYLHPDDLSAWGDRAPQIVQSLTACADTTLVPDPHSTRGGCRIETRHGEIDARVETMLHRIAEELVDD